MDSASFNSEEHWRFNVDVVIQESTSCQMQGIFLSLHQWVIDGVMRGVNSDT